MGGQFCCDLVVALHYQSGGLLHRRTTHLRCRCRHHRLRFSVYFSNFCWSKYYCSIIIRTLILLQCRPWKALKNEMHGQPVIEWWITYTVVYAGYFPIPVQTSIFLPGSRRSPAGRQTQFIAYWSKKDTCRGIKHKQTFIRRKTVTVERGITFTCLSVVYWAVIFFLKIFYPRWGVWTTYPLCVCLWICT